MRNISRSGLAIVLPAAVRPGSVLFVQLDEPTGCRRQPCLVRVRHAKHQPGDEWLAGCSFVRRLTDAEFHGIIDATSEEGPPLDLADPSVETMPGSEWRRSPRKSNAVAPAVRIKPINVLRPESIGRLYDRSDGGLGILSLVAFPVGSVLNVRVESAVKGAVADPWVQLRVQHCRPTERQWILGCRFVNNPEAQFLKQFEG